MRPVDLAREHGLSTQAVRNYEAAGVLPASTRAPSGYRTYTDVHARALRAFLALVPGHGHAGARTIMNEANAGRVERALELVDRGHADLLADRRTVDAVERALQDLTDPDPTGLADPDPGPADPARATGSLPIGALAHQLGLRPATLRQWERAGLLGPARDRAGHRVYAPADVRDAHLVGQLRRSGHPLARIAPLLADLRRADTAAAGRALVARRADLDARARAMLRGAAHLHAHLGSPTTDRDESGGRRESTPVTVPDPRRFP